MRFGSRAKSLKRVIVRSGKRAKIFLGLELGRFLGGLFFWLGVSIDRTHPK
jgi:hypothetical protein